MSSPTTVLPNEKKCTGCGHLMTNYDSLSLRKGGFLGILSELGEIFEKHFAVKSFTCTKCGHIDFYSDQ